MPGLPTQTGLWAVTVAPPRQPAYKIDPPFACANMEAAVEMARAGWTAHRAAPFPPVVKVEKVGEVWVSAR